MDYCDVFISCSSFWRHPFTAEHPLVSKSCNATFLQICSHEQTISSTCWMAWGWGHSFKFNANDMKHQTLLHKLIHTQHVNTLEFSDIMFTQQGKTQPKQTRRRAKHNGKKWTQIRCCFAERKKSIATAWKQPVQGKLICPGTSDWLYE